MKPIEINPLIRTENNLKVILGAFITYGIAVIDKDGLAVTGKTVIDTTNRYFILIPEVEVMDRGYYMLNEDRIEVNEIESLVKAFGYEDLSDAMFFGYDYGEDEHPIGEMIRDDEHFYDVIMKALNKVRINLFWTDEDN